jgi:hypothetical protein
MGKIMMTVQLIGTEFEFPFAHAMLNIAMGEAFRKNRMTVMHTFLLGTTDARKLQSLDMVSACQNSSMKVAAKKVSDIIRFDQGFRTVQKKGSPSW